MSLRKESEELLKVTLNVYATDWKWMQETYLKVGASRATRQILRAHRQKVQAKIKSLPKTNLEVELNLEEPAND